jgi:hypothetical protein
MDTDVYVHLCVCFLRQGGVYVCVVIYDMKYLR